MAGKKVASPKVYKITGTLGEDEAKAIAEYATVRLNIVLPNKLEQEHGGDIALKLVVKCLMEQGVLI